MKVGDIVVARNVPIIRELWSCDLPFGLETTLARIIEISKDGRTIHLEIGNPNRKGGCMWWWVGRHQILPTEVHVLISYYLTDVITLDTFKDYYGKTINQASIEAQLLQQGKAVTF